MIINMIFGRYQDGTHDVYGFASTDSATDIADAFTSGEKIILRCVYDSTNGWGICADIYFSLIGYEPPREDGGDTYPANFIVSSGGIGNSDGVSYTSYFAGCIVSVDDGKLILTLSSD